jgi:hypothetical protein
MSQFRLPQLAMHHRHWSLVEAGVAFLAQHDQQLHHLR